jgi:hypothetical protein
VTGKKIKAKKMGIFVSTLRHNSDKKTVTENKKQNNVRQYKIGEFLCDITKYDFWICGILQVFPNLFGGLCFAASVRGARISLCFAHMSR